MSVMAKYADKHFWYMLIHLKSTFKSAQQTVFRAAAAEHLASLFSALLVNWNVIITITDL